MKKININEQNNTPQNANNPLGNIMNMLGGNVSNENIAALLREKMGLNSYNGKDNNQDAGQNNNLDLFNMLKQNLGNKTSAKTKYEDRQEESNNEDKTYRSKDSVDTTHDKTNSLDTTSEKTSSDNVEIDENKVQWTRQMNAPLSNNAIKFKDMMARHDEAIKRIMSENKKED